MAESKREDEIIKFIHRYIKCYGFILRGGVIAKIDNEYIYHTHYLRKLLNDENNLTEVHLSFIDEKGGILSVNNYLKELKKFIHLLKFPEKSSGFVFTPEILNKFQIEK
ncbi:MAG: hypothetical protein ACUVT3_10110 [Ignavibacterium sp.]